MFSGVGPQTRFDASAAMPGAAFNPKAANDTLMNSILHELKSIKLNEPNGGEHSYDKQPRSHERAIVKSNDYTKSAGGAAHAAHHTNLPGKLASATASAQWMQPHNIDTSLKSIYHRSDGYSTSKESVWASTQSSPNSTQRDHSKNQFKKSSSTPANLWETPNSKLSQATLMMKNDSSSTVWFTPPQMQSPAMATPATGQSLWDTSAGTTSSILNRSAESFSPDVSLLRPQDLSPMDIWSSPPKMPAATNGGGSAGSGGGGNGGGNGGGGGAYTPLKANDTNASSIWRNPSPIGGKLECNVFTSTPYKSSPLDSLNECNKMGNAPANNSAGANSASSACLQLFSDDFMNYLNMIN